MEVCCEVGKEITQASLGTLVESLEDEELCIFINDGWTGGPGMMDLVKLAWTNRE